jgi:hypothetical protein
MTGKRIIGVRVIFFSRSQTLFVNAFLSAKRRIASHVWATSLPTLMFESAFWRGQRCCH